MVAPRFPEAGAQSSIVAAATKLFAAQGVEATSVQAIADEVGLTKQAVLHHYPSKEHLRHAVLGAILAHWNDALPRLLLAAAASEDRFEAVFGELHGFFAKEPDRARVILREVLDRPAEMKKLLRGPVKPWLDAVAGYVQTGKEAGKHHADVDPEAYVMLVMNLVIGAAACASVVNSVLDEHAGARNDKELARIARSSLFASPRPRGTSTTKR